MGLTGVLVSGDAVGTTDGIPGNAVLIRGDQVVAVGDREHLLAPGVTEERYPGSVIVPGLVDTHVHPVGIAGLDAGADVHDAGDIDDLVQRLRAVDAPAGVVVGHRLDEHRLAERRLPTRIDLDAVPLPVVVYRVCGHVAVANTAALMLGGVEPGTPNPPGGSIDTDDLGRPTGVLREEAIPLVTERLPRPATLGTRVVCALERMRSEGLTRIGAIVSAADGPWCTVEDELGELVAAGRDLPIGVHAFIATTDAAALEAAAETIRNAGVHRLCFGGVKLFADGSYGGGTAAMRDGDGITRLVVDRDRALAEIALGLGGDVAVHAIGDGAVASVLALFEKLIEGGTDPRRLRMEHASTTPDDLIERIAGLGIGVGIQPAFVASEHEWLPGALGSAATDAHRFGSMAAAGVRLGGGSDGPVEPTDPLWGMRWARSRATLTPSEEVDGATALGWWTNGAHDLLGVDPPLGAGSPADLTILSADPTTTPPAQLADLDVVGVWVDGDAQRIA